MRKLERVYLAIVSLDKQGSYITPKMIADRAGYHATSRISEILEQLETGGIISRTYHSWSECEVRLLREVKL